MSFSSASASASPSHIHVHVRVHAVVDAEADMSGVVSTRHRKYLPSPSAEMLDNNHHLYNTVL